MEHKDGEGEKRRGGGRWGGGGEEIRRSLLNLAINTMGGNETGNTSVTTVCPSC